MSKSPEFVSIAECARLLTAIGDEVKRKALSEYCDSHNLKQQGSGKRQVVNFEAVKLHRQQNGMRSIMSGNGLEQPKAEAEVPKLPSLEERRQDPTFRKKEAEAELAALSLERQRGNLVVKDEVEAGIADMFATLRAAEASTIGEAVNALVSELKLGAEGRKLIKRHLKQFSRDQQSAFHEKAGEVVAGLNQSNESHHRDRLSRLAAEAHRLQRRPVNQTVHQIA